MLTAHLGARADVKMGGACTAPSPPPLAETCAPPQPGCTPIYRAGFWGLLDPSIPVPSLGEDLHLPGVGLKTEHTLQRLAA